MKVRIFPNQQETERIDLILNQHRWYYNATVQIVANYFKDDLFSQDKVSFPFIRDLIRKHVFIEDSKEFLYDQDVNQVPIPSWWKHDKPHSRLPRGAVKKFVGGLNGALTNLKNGHIKNFTMKYSSKRSKIHHALFEDLNFPTFLKKIKGVYWYRDGSGKRRTCPLKDIDTKKGLEIVYEKETGRYFLHIPVPQNWYPLEDRRLDIQERFVNQGNRIISLDPGIRKFLVGYDPTGKSTYFGDKSYKIISELLYDIDREGYDFEKWKRIKDLVDEMHWKTISYLTENYDVILLPKFEVSRMIKGKKLPKIIKRMMCMFSFYQFRTKLMWRCSVLGKRLIIVDESYTSKTCGVCGHLNNVGKSETFDCSCCGLTGDRDGLAARNILLKNLRWVDSGSSSNQ